MKQKLEFPLFYLIWLTAFTELILSFVRNATIPIGIVGIIMLIASAGFSWAQSGADETIRILLPVTRWAMVLSIIISSFVSRSPVMLTFVGVAVLAVMHVERGYMYVYTYES